MAELETITIKGRVVQGVMRGADLVKKYKQRIKNLLGFEPFEGTLDIRLEKQVNMYMYYSKKIEHVLLDGSHQVDAFLAPVVLHIKNENYRCWAIRQTESVYKKDIIEIIASENIKEKFGLENKEEVMVTFFKQREEKKPVTNLVKKMNEKQKELMKK